MVSITAPEYLEGPLLYDEIQHGVDWALLIYDFGTLTERLVDNELLLHETPVGFRNNGCTIELSNGALLDLHGNVVSGPQDLDLRVLDSLDENHFIEKSSLSPDGMWSTFFLGYGERYYEYSEWSEFYDLAMVNMERPDELIFVTDSGEVYTDYWSLPGYYWSPDSQWLYYQENDDLNNRQVFRYAPASGEYEQLTHYSDGHDRLGPQFSPDFTYFANMRYGVDHDENGRRYREYDVAERPIEIVTISNLSKKTVLLQTEKFGGVRMTQPHTIAWNPDAKTIAVFGHDGDGMVFWIDVSSGEITDVLELEDWAWDYAPAINPHWGVEQLELKGREGWFLFDRETREWTNLPFTTNVLVSATGTTPPEFLGEENCDY